MKRVACAVLALCLVACNKSSDLMNVSSDEIAVHTKAVSITREVEFKFNADQFVNAFDAAAKSSGHSFRIGTFEVKHGAVHDYFKQNFSDTTSLTVTVSKDTGHIISVTALVAGDPDEIDHSAVIAVSEIIAAATNPNLTQQKASALVSDMLQESSSNHDAGKFPQRFINNVRYVLRNDSGIGYWLMANPV